MAFTYFFRDLQTLELLCDALLKQNNVRKQIKIWDAGCAMGPEVFSLAIIIRERMGKMSFRNVKITASDIDESNRFKEIIEKGRYSYSKLQRIPKALFEKYFIKLPGSDEYEIVEEIKNSVTFYKHDLTTLKPIEKGYDAIICKNVLLHFDEKTRENVVNMYYDSLKQGGYFGTEQTQKIPSKFSDKFEPVYENAKIYKRM